MREPCCLANEQEWELAADWDFKIKNWPYINAKVETVKKCFYDLDKDSPQNLLKSGSSHLAVNLMITLLASTFTLAHVTLLA